MADPKTRVLEGFTLPPTRGAKRIVGISVDTTTLPFEGRKGGGDDSGVGKASLLAATQKAFGGKLPSFTQALHSDKVVQTYTTAQGTKALSQLDFEQTRVRQDVGLASGLMGDFIYIKLKSRGFGGADLVWKFLVNPETIQINRQVVDAESMSRAGLQTGIWGDLTDISISGVTAGQYFAGVLVDMYGEQSRSFSSVMELMAVYENNGTWFEGESTGNAAAADAITRKQMQIQADVELAYGNFIWSGCFTEMTLDDSADTPYYNKFTLGFMAWKERFRRDSPWRNSISDNQYFGHAYELYERPKKAADKAPNSQEKEAAGAAASATNNQGSLRDTIKTGGRA